jgi:hypothetical protein
VRYTGGEWELATEVTFHEIEVCFRARVRTGDRPRYAAGDDFTAIVDGGAMRSTCSAKISRRSLGSLCAFEMEALEPTGWRPVGPRGFISTSGLRWGVVVRNVEPSRFDPGSTGRDFTEVEATQAALNPLRCLPIRRRAVVLVMTVKRPRDRGSGDWPCVGE